MNEVIELALKNGLLLKTTNLDLCPSYLDKLQAFYEAAKAQGAKEFREALGEPVAWIWRRHNSSDLRKNRPPSARRDLWEPLYALPNTKDEVK